MGRVFVNASQSVPASVGILVNMTFVNPRLIYFYTPTWPISNTSVVARVQLTINNQNWNDLGYYIYGKLKLDVPAVQL